MSEPYHPSPRVLSLEGGHNFREVAGYPSQDGSTVRRGLIWRSAGLDRLSEEDCAVIHALGIRTIADLRTEGERISFPTASGLAGSVHTLFWPPAKGAGHADWSSESPFAGREMDSDQLHGVISKLYTRIADDHLRHFGDLYRAMANGGAPILVHCTAGKDRTGLAIGLLLELLGVAREWVLWDYEQTNLHLRKEMVVDQSVIGVGGLADWMAGLTPEGRDIVLSVDRRYLVSALSAIEEQYGSVEQYADQRLGIDTAALAALRRQLLEPAASRADD
ncbi:MAG TPA: tyrosine-protein phosphatase [Caulobacteraceae bacterium]|jgi:protein-tyrosine phosphatase